MVEIGKPIEEVIVTPHEDPVPSVLPPIPLPIEPVQVPALVPA